MAINILAPLGIIAAASAIDAGIQKKIHGSETRSLVNSNVKINVIVKIVQAFENSNILLKGITKTIKNETKKRKGVFLNMLLCTLGASLLGNMLAGKGIVRASFRKGIVRTVSGNEMDFYDSSFNKLWNKNYYQNERRFNGVYSRNNLPKKDGTYVINFDEYADVGTHWVALFCKRSEIVYFDSFGIEYVPEEVKGFIENKNIKANIFRVEANN